MKKLLLMTMLIFLSAIFFGQETQSQVMSSYFFISSGNWNDGTHWNTGEVPPEGSDVIIMADAVIPAGYTAIANQVNLQGGSITVADGGQLKHNTQDLVVTMEKSIAAFNEENSWSNYYLLAFPFNEDVAVPATMTAAEDNDFYTFDPDYPYAEWRNNKQHVITTVGGTTGYLYANSEDIELSLTGSTYQSYGEAIVTVEVPYTEGSSNIFNGWALLGNPYTCNAYVYAFENGSCVPKEFMVYNADGELVRCFCSSIAPMQGFFVKVEETTTICIKTTAPYVDLGLPSGTLWAACNVGAVTPEDYGDYFAWGETQPKDTYNWNTYQYYDGSSVTKYTGNDGLTTLLPEDDAATVNWGSDWRMPTNEEWQELYNNTTHVWTMQDGVNGRLFTAENGNSLFLPAGGIYSNGSLGSTGNGSYYWSSSLSIDSPNLSWQCSFYSNGCNSYEFARFFGISVRPVRSTFPPPSFIINAISNPAEGGEISGAGNYQEGMECTLTATPNEGFTFTNWTENNSVVSTDVSYNFIVTGNRTLMANFGYVPAPQVVVTTSEPMLITAISAMCGGEVTVNDETYIIVKGLCWATHENPTTNDFYQEAESGVGSFTISMTDLNIGTTYYVRAFAVTHNGTIYGEQKAFTTRDGIPTVTTAEVTGIYGEIAICGGTITDNGGLNITTRGVCWSTTPDPTLNDSHTTNGMGMGSFVSVLTDLTLNTTYYVRAYATNSHTTVYGNQHSFTAEPLPDYTIVVSSNPMEGGTVNVEPVFGNYTRISDISQLVSGSRVVFAARFDNNTTDYYAMSNTSFGKPMGVLFTSATVDENEILPTSIVEEESSYYWIVGVTANGYTFTNANNELIGWSSSTNFATGGDNIGWSIELGTAGDEAMVPNYSGFLVTNVNNTVRHFALNSNHNFGSYHSNNFNSSDYNYYLDIFMLDQRSYTVQATANEGYIFTNWTENGEVVSTEATYTFIVNADRTLVANFTYNGGGGDHAYVDLGLPSGTLWATCNVGANAPEEYGDYFAWGETQSKDVYDWSTYQYCMGSYNTLTKYCNDANYGYNGFTDNLTTLLPENDAATTNWGNCWRLPTKEEWEELYNNTTVIWTTQNGVNGRLFTANNSNSLFLPAASSAGSSGHYWSNSLYTDYPSSAWGFGFYSDVYAMSGRFNFRCSGRSVRAVRMGLQNNAPTGAIDGKFTINADRDQVYFSQGNLQYQASTDTWKFADNQYDFVGSDNSNISSTYSGWIDLFGWGTSGYHNSSDPYNVNYQPWSTSDSYVNSSYNSFGYGPSTNMTDPNLTGTSANYDWGVYNPISNGGNTANQWRTLTEPEWDYVFNARTTASGIRYAKANVNNVNGVILLPDDWSSTTYSLSSTNSNGASFNSNTLTVSQWRTLEQAGAVFLPAAGYRDLTSVYNVGSYGNYWSASFFYSSGAYYVFFYDSYLGPSNCNSRYIGRSVRLVCPAEN